MLQETKKIEKVSINEITIEQIASICDHTFLERVENFRDAIKEGKSAIQSREKSFHAFLEHTLNLPSLPYALCIRPEDCSYVYRFLKTHRLDKDIAVCSVVGFPDGNAYSHNFKKMESHLAIEAGAKEIDTTLPFKNLKKGDLRFVETNILSVSKICRTNNVKLKLIIESSELTTDEIQLACRIAKNSGVDFIKTSSGFSSKGASLEALKTIRKYFPGGIKISGGVKKENFKDFLHVLSENSDGKIHLNPKNLRIGESKLLNP